MRDRLLCGFLLLLFSAFPAFGQGGFTTVGGAIVDPTGIPWSGGTITAQLITQGGAAPTLNGQPFTSTTASGLLGPGGTFTMRLGDNGVIVPSTTTWQFTVSIAPGVLPPAGKGPQSFVVTTAINCGMNTPSTCTSNSMTITSTLAPVPTLTFSGVPANSPLPSATSGPGPVFNVKNYGAKGDSQATSSVACTFTGGQAQFTCTGITFNSARDVGKNIFCNSNNAGASFFGNSLQTIVSVQNATTATASTTSGFSATGGCVWGTIDDTGIGSASTAALAASKSAGSAAGNNAPFISTPQLYFPAGGYLVCSLLAAGVANTASTNIDGFTFAGDGPDQTFLYPGGGGACPLVGSVGSFINFSTGSNFQVRSFTIDGVNNTVSGGSPQPILLTAATHISDVIIQRWGGSAGISLAGPVQAERVTAVANPGGPGILCTSCNGEWRDVSSSNNGNFSNVVIQNVVGFNTGQGLRIYGGLIDECGTASFCFSVINSTDVWMNGTSIFGAANGAATALNIDANSYVHWYGGTAGPFGGDGNPASGGVSIAAGGTLESASVRYIARTTGKCITNNGTFLDNGANSCEQISSIASGTSTGTTAVLTAVTTGVNTRCAIGDSLQVEGAQGTGYTGYFPFGVTGTSATTVTYTTQGSNLGAIGTGGTFYCRNLISYSGNLPRALLNNPVPNTCYITGTFGATTTAAPMCNFFLGAATNITHVTASSTTSTTCASAPVVTITDGTGTITLTITSGKSKWDSAVDASSGVGTTIFKPNGTITLSNTAGTCATPPTNFSVSYNIAPILSN